MTYSFAKQSKKSPKPSQQHIFLGIPTNIAAGSLGFRAELDISTKGEHNRFRHNLGASMIQL